ncbi:hypothetical protein Zmor_022575 [Zophobas morio]|uniref:SH2 domain-containing protein n=1 Tax=Zophobas morio TaxID=2755281 RepID=A0AA38M6K1_9CUCU|nr:hypothetical protein Zmor_022575 [Zophobas morio]
MNVHKQMCWCFKVFCGVLTNLTYRLYSESLDVLYKMCSLCCCARGRNNSRDCGGVKDEKEEFYKDVEREVAEDLLKNKQFGTFIIRPSKNCYLATLSVVQDDKIFHLNIRKRGDGLVALGTEKDNEKCFQDINSLINYYISNYLVLCSRGEKTMTLLLPYRTKATA